MSRNKKIKQFSPTRMEFITNKMLLYWFVIYISYLSFNIFILVYLQVAVFTKSRKYLVSLTLRQTTVMLMTVPHTVTATRRNATNTSKLSTLTDTATMIATLMKTLRGKLVLKWVNFNFMFKLNKI